MTLSANQETTGTASEDVPVDQLVRAAAGSDPRAWKALTDRFGGLVWSVARASGLDRTDSADVCQTVWLRLVDHIGRLRQPERLAGWLATTTRNEAMRVSGHRRRTIPTSDVGQFDRDPGPDGDVDPATPLGRYERDAAVREVVGTLPARSQALLQMLMSDPPASYCEVAAGLGMPMGSVGPTRQRCLVSLRAKCVSAGIGL